MTAPIATMMRVRLVAGGIAFPMPARPRPEPLVARRRSVDRRHGHVVQPHVNGELAAMMREMHQRVASSTGACPRRRRGRRPQAPRLSAGARRRASSACAHRRSPARRYRFDLLPRLRLTENYEVERPPRRDVELSCPIIIASHDGIIHERAAGLPIWHAVSSRRGLAALSASWAFAVDAGHEKLGQFTGTSSPHC